MKFLSGDDLIEMFGCLELDKATDLLIPLNDANSLMGGGNHWTTLHIKDKSKVYFYDSMN